MLRIGLAVVDEPETRIGWEGGHGRVLRHESVASTSMACYAVDSDTIAAVVDCDF